jgi:hypothetical protein
LPYGFSADVYSFGILAWQVIALQTPFADYDADLHFDRVVAREEARSLCIASYPSYSSKWWKIAGRRILQREADI